MNKVFSYFKSIRRESKKRPRLPIFPLPDPNDLESWQKILFGHQVPFVKYESDEEGTANSVQSSVEPEQATSSNERILDLNEIKNGIPPLLRVVLRLTTHQSSALFDLFSNLIESNQSKIENYLENMTKFEEILLILLISELQPKLAEWIFALLSAQTTPIEPSIASRMRSVCRVCRKIRYHMVNQKY